LTSAQTTIIANPVIHDKSDNQYSTTGNPWPGAEDRTVRYQNGTTTTQKNMAGTGMTFADTQKLISYLPPGINGDGTITRVPRADFVTGTVDMKAYLDWLNANGYNINLTVQ
jgi:hypothetical protein